jgi:hypothetical protein
VKCRYAYNNEAHSQLALSSSPVCSKHKDDDGDRNGSNSHCEFSICSLSDDDHELDCEAQEEEKIKLQEGNIDLGRLVEINSICTTSHLLGKSGIFSSSLSRH